MVKKGPFIDKNDYLRDKEERLISRKIAYKEIYRKNRDNYRLPFREYVVHHIDGDKYNNSIKNLFICIQKDHDLIHEEQNRTEELFNSSKDIEIFLNKQNNRSLRPHTPTKTIEDEDYKDTNSESNSGRGYRDSGYYSGEYHKEFSLRSRFKTIGVWIVSLFVFVLVIAFIFKKDLFWNIMEVIGSVILAGILLSFVVLMVWLLMNVQD